MEFRGHRGHWFVGVVVLGVLLAFVGDHPIRSLIISAVALGGWCLVRQTSIRVADPWLYVSFWPARAIGFKVALVDIEAVVVRESVPFSRRLGTQGKVSVFLTRRRNVLELTLPPNGLALLVSLDAPAQAAEAIRAAVDAASAVDRPSGRPGLRPAFRGATVSGGDATDHGA